MKNNKILRLICFVLIVMWALLVFYMSHQQGGDSSGLSRWITSLFFKSEEIINIIEPYVRKIAHFCEYGLGGILFISLFLTYDWSERKQIGISIFLGIWYSILDEIHQLLVPGRNGNAFDVIIDSLGICVGVFCTMFIYKLVLKIKKKNLSSNN